MNNEPVTVSSVYEAEALQEAHEMREEAIKHRAIGTVLIGAAIVAVVLGCFVSWGIYREGWFRPSFVVEDRRVNLAAPAFHYDANASFPGSVPHMLTCKGLMRDAVDNEDLAFGLDVECTRVERTTGYAFTYRSRWTDIARMYGYGR